MMKAQDRHQNAGPEFGQELAGTTAGEQASPHDPIEGETSREKAQASIIPHPEEPIIRGSTEQEIQPATEDTEEAGESTQQTQTDELAEKEAHAPLAPEPVTEGNTDHNGHTEQGTGSKDDTATPDSTSTDPHRQEQQPSHDASHEITPEVGQDIRTEPGILDILESE